MLQRKFRLEAELFDGVSTIETASLYFELNSGHDEIAASGYIYSIVANELTGSGKPYDGWTLNQAHYWPVFCYTPQA